MRLPNPRFPSEEDLSPAGAAYGTSNMAEEGFAYTRPVEHDQVVEHDELNEILSALWLPIWARSQCQPPSRLEAAVWDGQTEFVHVFLALGADLEQAIRRMLENSSYGAAKYRWLADFAGEDLVERVRAGKSIDGVAKRLRPDYDDLLVGFRLKKSPGPLCCAGSGT